MTITGNLFGQNSNIFTLGGPSDDYGHSIDITAEGDYLIAGTTESIGFGNKDFMLTKCASNGEVLWSKSVGSSLHEDGVFTTVKSLSNGNICLIGFNKPSQNSKRRSICILLNSFGEVIWTLMLDTGEHETPRGIEEMANGDLIILGTTNALGEGSSDALISRITQNGNVSWTRTFGTPNASRNDHFADVAELSNGHIIAIGNSECYAGSDQEKTLLVEYSSDGQLLNEYSYIDADYSILEAIEVDENDNLYLGGASYTGLNNNSYDAIIMKLNSEFEVQWQRKAIAPGDDKGSGLALNISGCSRTFYNEVSNSLLTLNFDLDGNLSWTTEYTSEEELYVSTLMHNSTYGDDGSLVCVASVDHPTTNNDVLVLIIEEENQECTSPADVLISNETFNRVTLNCTTNEFSLWEDFEIQSMDISSEIIVTDFCTEECNLEASFSVLPICVEEFLSLDPIVQNGSNTLNYNWRINGEEVSNEVQLEILFESEGEFLIELTVTDTENGCIAETSETITVNPLPTIIDIPDQTICDGEELFIEPQVTNYQVFLWADNYSELNRTIDQSGSYQLDVIGSCGASSVSFNINIVDNPIAALLDEYQICDGESIDFDLSDDYMTVLNNSFVGSEFSLSEAGNHVISASADGCEFTHDFTIEVLVEPELTIPADIGQIEFCSPFDVNEMAEFEGSNYSYDEEEHALIFEESNECFSSQEIVSIILVECEEEIETPDVSVTSEEPEEDCELNVWIPNTFTPNSDNLNEIFRPVISCYVKPENYHFVIYNRWGNIVFETNDVTIGWDGSVKSGSHYSTNDVYAYQLILNYYSENRVESINETGSVIIIR